jgi:D-aminopeptidase
MRPGPGNRITDIPGLSVGQAADARWKTGVTVVVGDAPMTAGVHVMGGAPGTRETDLLAPEATVGGVDALVLSGGSAFGLAAADGVAAGLRADDRGFAAAGHAVPIVPAAILFDLGVSGAGWAETPYPALGRAAYAARGAEVALGTAGAGTGATVAGLKGGLGTASALMPSGAVVGALVAVNSVGQVTVGEGPRFWAAPFEQEEEFGGLGIETLPAPPPRTKLDRRGTATTIAIVATDLALTKAEAKRMAVAAHDGIARAVVPAHTPFDGDLVFACATGWREATDEDRFLLGHWAATCLARAIARGVFHAHAAEGDALPTWGAMFGRGY